MNKVIPQLLDQIQTVAHQHKTRIVYTLVSDNALHEHNHCQGFTATLSMPNDAASGGAIILTVDATHRIFNAKELLISGDLLNTAIIQNKEPDNIQQAFLGKHRHDHSVLLSNVAIIYVTFCRFLLPLHIFFVPLAVKFLLCSCSTVFHGFRIHSNGQLRKLKQLRNIIRLPVADILFYAFFHVHAGLFTFNHNQRNTIHKHNDIRACIFAVGTLHRKLICNLPNVIFRVLPVDVRNVKGLRVPIIKVYITALAVNQSIINCLAGKHQTAL